MFRSTFLHEKVNYGRFYELAENDLDMHAMFLKIINHVCRKIIISIHDLSPDFVIRLMRRVPLVQKEQFTLLEHLSSPQFLVGFVHGL
jgi:hypothetical protein